MIWWNKKSKEFRHFVAFLFSLFSENKRRKDRSKHVAPSSGRRGNSTYEVEFCTLKQALQFSQFLVQYEPPSPSYCFTFMCFFFKRWNKKGSQSNFCVLGQIKRQRVWHHRWDVTNKSKNKNLRQNKMKRFQQKVEKWSFSSSKSPNCTKDNKYPHMQKTRKVIIIDHINNWTQTESCCNDDSAQFALKWTER